MKNHSNIITIGVLFAATFAALIIWVEKQGSGAYLIRGIGTLTILVGAYIFYHQIVAIKKHLKDNAPPEDEFTNYAKLVAGNKAFHYSFYLWLLIVIFNSSFSSQELMLGVGILGSALIYGIVLWYFNITGNFNEQ